MQNTYKVAILSGERRITSYNVCYTKLLRYDGESAFAAVEQYHPHILFTDIKMPLLDGLSLIERIHASNPDLRCVLISGYGES